MKDEQDALSRVATAVADGAAIDWDGENRTHEHLRRKLRRLQTIEKIADVHRSPDLDEDPTAPLPLTRWGPLKIVGWLGQGGYADVYRAHDPGLQKEVALKLVRSDQSPDRRTTRRFLQEARRLARVRHANVLAVHGADVHEDRAGLWTDVIEGKTLEAFLAQQGPLGWEEAAVIGGVLCRALAAVHAAGLVHHDVKTGNIMREDGGRIVLMDFNTVADRFAASARADSDAAIGTPRFMAPERFTGKDSGRASDIYSLGVVLYRLVTRRFPIEVSDFAELAAKQARGERVPLRDVRPDLPQAFVQVVERALEHDPARRYATVGEMERALTAARGAPVVDDKLRPRRPWWDHPLFRGAVVVGAALVLGTWLANLPRSFHVETSLYRAGVGTEERLLPGGKVAPGDDLFLEIKGSTEMNVYVLNEDEAGEAFVLFPLPNLDLQNPLAADSLHRLPGTIQGKSNYWTVTSAGGTERFLVIASRNALEVFEQEIAGVPRARLAGGVKISTQGMERLRGIGGLTEASPPDGDDARRPFTGLLQGIQQRASTESGIWTWEIRLDNPDS
jgi:tRNA A-37 threonylcarbamoyl transferase component Bud32